MNNTIKNEMTFRYALSVLEEQFDSTYRGISTVKEMTTDLMSAISFEGENPETVYHRFETKVGPNRIVKEDQVIALAQHYVWTFLMNYTLKELQQRVNQLIEQQGENAYCAAWIYTKDDCYVRDLDGELNYDLNVDEPEVVERIFDDVGNIDYIYQVIQECVDEATEEQYMEYQQELQESVWEVAHGVFTDPSNAL